MNTMAMLALRGSLIFPPLGIIFGHLGLRQIQRTGEEGHVLAIAGLTIGYIYTGFIVLALLFMPFAVIIAASAGA